LRGSDEFCPDDEFYEIDGSFALNCANCSYKFIPMVFIIGRDVIKYVSNCRSHTGEDKM
jgi:hypothetical protein